MSLGYLYIGLLRPAKSELGLEEISSDKTGYHRVEMTPIDWEFFFENEAMGILNGPIEEVNTIINAVPIVFSPPKKEWGTITNFGVYNSLKGKDLIVIGVLNKPVYITAKVEEINFNPGRLKIALDVLIKNGDKQ